jgi:hypothetical protein
LHVGSAGSIFRAAGRANIEQGHSVREILRLAICAWSRGGFTGVFENRIDTIEYFTTGTAPHFAVAQL